MDGGGEIINRSMVSVGWGSVPRVTRVVLFVACLRLIGKTEVVRVGSHVLGVSGLTEI